jgi:hypothetical protein
MQTWEYKLIVGSDFKGEGFFGIPDREGLERALNELGRAGWEVVNMDFAAGTSLTACTALLKRPVQ